MKYRKNNSDLITLFYIFIRRNPLSIKGNRKLNGWYFKKPIPNKIVMANIKKNGKLSGTMGDIVFVNDGDRAFTRTKPESVKQSPATKASAKVFGMVSQREKWFRLRLLKELDMPALQYFAARHRSRITKTVTGNSSSNSGNKTSFGNPQALAGFCFNPKLEWQRCTNFFPVFEILPDNEMTVQLPQLQWKKQIIPPKNCSSATLTLLAITADLNTISCPLKVQSKLVLQISALSALPDQEWNFPVTASEGWIAIAASLKFNTTNHAAKMHEQYAATYLWAGLPNE